MNGLTKIKFLFTALFAFGGLTLVALSQSHPQTNSSGGPVGPSALWRPRKDVRGGSFAGDAACAKCHKEITTLQRNTVMAKALHRPADCEILSARKEMSFRSGPYLYRIVRQGKESLYTVTDGKETFAEPILYCFGQGKAGQTYVFRHDNSFFESRVSFYGEIQGLDYTIGYPRVPASSLVEAAGRAISTDEATGCFSCHSTGAVHANSLKLDQLMPGVSCEACHGPGEKHILSAGEGNSNGTHIFNPARLDADQLAQEFCGACHRSVDEVSRMPNLGGGVNNVRFQPYRLFNSRGHDAMDARLSCTACHDPHDNLRREASFYDAKCSACHQTKGEGGNRAALDKLKQDGRTAKACPVGNSSCVTCHMPRVELTGSHFKFTDHRIRIARAGEPYPN